MGRGGDGGGGCDIVVVFAVLVWRGENSLYRQASYYDTLFDEGDSALEGIRVWAPDSRFLFFP